MMLYKALRIHTGVLNKIKLKNFHETRKHLKYEKLIKSFTNDGKNISN